MDGRNIFFYKMIYIILDEIKKERVKSIIKCIDFHFRIDICLLDFSSGFYRAYKRSCKQALIIFKL